MTAQEKFQNLLRELFQFDLADLDFGIYRILNYKRRVIEKWLNEDLPRAIREELRKGALAEQAEAQRALEETRQKVLETLGEDAIDAEGNLAERYRNTRVGREYLEARAKAAHAQPAEALEAAVYNHLYTFFSRYWQDGDFISKRRYSKKERYAIPYNGEEVYLYWANHDQYYVKTAEHFTDYTWKAPGGVTVHFKLQAADVEVNNVKGEKRFFIPVLEGIAWDAEARTLTIPFHYRPLTEREKITYADKQEKILEEALQAIPDRLRGNADALAALTAERRRDAQGNPVSWLEHHLRQYTARNTRDFFIHKDLRGFLSRELDFYLKNEVLNLDELEAAGSGTTGHAVINLNREDGGRRRFILVEMGEYFDTVLLPRIKKVTFTPEWKDGKPKRMATREEFERGPRIVKVIRLESYEDALNNITLDEESGQKALDLFGDEYLLRYMLRWESKKSETFLDVEQLQTPFCYKLRIHRDGETREQPVDLPETFAYLIGLDVERREVYYNEGRRYLVYRGMTRDGRRVAVIWRETKGWSKEDYRRDAAFVAEQKMTEGADEIFVNSDSFIPGARSLDGIFKARLFGEEG
jgi:hypothetical protein